MMTEKLPGSKEKPLIQRLVRSSSRAGVGAGAALIGLALFLLFRGFGVGPGSGSREDSAGTKSQGSGQDASASMILAANTDAPTTTEDADKSKEKRSDDDRSNRLTVDEAKAIAGDVLTVLIDEHDYLMQIPGTTDVVYRRCELGRLIELAKLTHGDTNGIRVRILRRESARASAESQIKFELVHAGISDDAVVMPQEFVP